MLVFASHGFIFGARLIFVLKHLLSSDKQSYLSFILFGFLRFLQYLFCNSSFVLFFADHRCFIMLYQWKYLSHDIYCCFYVILTRAIWNFARHSQWFDRVVAVDQHVLPSCIPSRVPVTWISSFCKLKWLSTLKLQQNH